MRFSPWICLAPSEATRKLALATCSFLLLVVKEPTHEAVDFANLSVLFSKWDLFFIIFNLKEMNKKDIGKSPPALSSPALLIISAEISDIHTVSVSIASSNDRGETAFLGCETTWVQDPRDLRSDRSMAQRR